MNTVISLNIKRMLELIDTFRGREASQTKLSRIREIGSSHNLRAVKSILLSFTLLNALLNREILISVSDTEILAI